MPYLAGKELNRTAVALLKDEALATAFFEDLLTKSEGELRAAGLCDAKIEAQKCCDALAVEDLLTEESDTTRGESGLASDNLPLVKPSSSRVPLGSLLAGPRVTETQESDEGSEEEKPGLAGALSKCLTLGCPHPPLRTGACKICAAKVKNEPNTKNEQKNKRRLKDPEQ